MANGSNKATLQRRDAKRRKRALQKPRSATKLTSPRRDFSSFSAKNHTKSQTDKLSRAILELTAGLIDEASDCIEREKIAKLAVLAWNLSLSDDPATELRKTAASIAPEDKTTQIGLERFVMSMIAHKKERYPNDKRLALDSQVHCTDTNFRLTVTAAIPAPAAASA